MTNSEAKFVSISSCFPVLVAAEYPTCFFELKKHQRLLLAYIAWLGTTVRILAMTSKTRLILSKDLHIKLLLFFRYWCFQFWFSWTLLDCLFSGFALRLRLSWQWQLFTIHVSFSSGHLQLTIVAFFLSSFYCFPASFCCVGLCLLAGRHSLEELKFRQLICVLFLFSKCLITKFFSCRKLRFERSYH